MSITTSRNRLIQAIADRVKREGKFSKPEAFYSEGVLPRNFPNYTGIPWNLFQAFARCERCMWYMPNAKKCRVVGKPADLGGEEISPDGLSAAFIPTDTQDNTYILSELYWRVLPGVTIEEQQYA